MCCAPIQPVADTEGIECFTRVHDPVLVTQAADALAILTPRFDEPPLWSRHRVAILQEYWTRLASQFEVCINTSKCDVTAQTVADTFIAGIPSKIRESIIMKGGPPIASNKLSMRTFVSECHKLFVVMKKNSMPTNSPSESGSLAATGVSVETNLEGVSSDVLAAELASRRGGAAALAAFGFSAGSQIPKFEGDRTALLRELRTS